MSAASKNVYSFFFFFFCERLCQHHPSADDSSLSIQIESEKGEYER